MAPFATLVRAAAALALLCALASVSASDPSAVSSTTAASAASAAAAPHARGTRVLAAVALITPAEGTPSRAWAVPTDKNEHYSTCAFYAVAYCHLSILIFRIELQTPCDRFAASVLLCNARAFLAVVTDLWHTYCAHQFSTTTLPYLTHRAHLPAPFILSSEPTLTTEHPLCAHPLRRRIRPAHAPRSRSDRGARTRIAAHGRRRRQRDLCDRD
jgi:hypothetical protein